ncbi:MAG TPA: tRNA adenosine(34) deaminase TadA [Longimicrobiales bacterium]
MPCEFGPARAEDALWMPRALEQARAAAVEDEVPVGAVVVIGGRIVAEGRNRTRHGEDPAGHAELIAIRRAAERAGRWALLDATVYVTLEPCAMCAGAMVLARIRRLVYATPDPKTGMCGSLACIVQDPRLNHRVELTRGVLADDSAEMLRAFFRARR